MKSFNKVTLNKFVLVAVVLLNCSISNYLTLNLKRTKADETKYEEALIKINALHNTSGILVCSDYQASIQNVINYLDEKRNQNQVEKEECYFSCEKENVNNFHNAVSLFREGTIAHPLLFVTFLAQPKQRMTECAKSRIVFELIDVLKKSKTISNIIFSKIKENSKKEHLKTINDLTEIKK